MVAPETAAHAAGTSALLPMLSLGVPGSPTAAVLLGGLLIWGLQPGPLLFVEQKEFVWGLIASMYLGNVVGLIIVLTCVPLFAAILRVPFSIIGPVILVMCAIGAYTVHNNTFDVVMMLVFGVVGYLLKKTNYPLAPMVLAIVLGDKAEEAFRQSLLASQGGLGVFFSTKLVSTIMVLGLIALFWPLISGAWAACARHGSRPEQNASGPTRHCHRIVPWNIVFQMMPNNRTMRSPAGRTNQLRIHAAAARIEPIDTSFSFKNKAYAALKNVIVSMDVYRSRQDIRLDERQLAQDFGISRTPVREAMAQLEREGFVRSVPRRGIYVVRKTKSEVIEMITAWAALESMAARLITVNASDEEIASLRKMFATFENGELRAHLDEYSEVNIEFHQTIIRMSGNSVLIDLAENLFTHMRMIRRKTIGEKDRVDRSIRDHMNIIEALEARDTARAEDLVRNHALGLADHVAKYADYLD